MAVVTTKEEVSPEQAKMWLESMEEGTKYGLDPRREKWSHAEAIFRDMLNGTFHDTGESIKFHEAGFLVDGQHRLKAQVLAGLTLVWTITRGLSTEAVRVLDSGISRTVRDVMTMGGVANANRVTATIRKLIVLAGGTFNERLSTSEHMQVLKAHPGIANSIKVAHRIPSLYGPSTNYAAVHYIGTAVENNSFLADEYITMLAKGRLEDGSLPYKYDAATALREKTSRRKKNTDVQWTMEYWIKISYHCWTLYRDRKEVRQIKVPDEVQVKGWTIDACFGRRVEAKIREKKRK